MLSPILPVSNPSSVSSTMPPASSIAANMFLRSEDNGDFHVPTTRVSFSSFQDDDSSIIEVKPFLPRASSFNSLTSTTTTTTTTTTKSSKFYRLWRRRFVSENSLSSLPGRGSGSRGHSFSQDVGEAASDTYRITRLCCTLSHYLGVGYRWITRFLALGCYAFLIFPGFLQVGYHYFFSSQIRRGVIYGDQPRNKLDLYLPKDTNGPKPVVAFVTGGAWIIGYKAWGSLLGQQLSERDIIVACIDYRNFPQGTMSDMVNDASQGISFICNNIAEYGGDPNRYNLLNLVDHFHNRGLYRSIFLSIMEGEQSLRRFSPEVMVQYPNIRSAVSLLPPVVLFHGTADYSIPSDASKTFAETLQRVGVKANSILYEGKTHTDLFLQDPMRGGTDEMFEDLVSLIHAGDPVALAKHAAAPPRKRLVPEFMLKLARSVSPF